MKSITIQLVRLKSLIENDVNMNGATSKIIAYASVEIAQGVFINGISIRQDVQNKNVKVIFPCRKIHNETQPFISFSSKQIEKEVNIEILNKVKDAMSKELESKDKDY